MFKKALYYSAVFCLLAVTAAALGVWLVIWAPGAAIREENIGEILAQESPVYYRDGQQKIGVFFEQAHRQYVPYEKVPRAVIDGLVAAEDHDFFQHHGVDFPGVLRALAANLRAGRVVQGGSTITQQTAKNLFMRSGRSVWGKLKELLNACRLEYHYPKEKILEFYLNQFYVSGNGRGIGVAARYYFDKEVSELNLLESAFIAGSVKRPNYYNPFIKRDEAAAAAARQRAKERAVYVLSQMLKLGTISQAEYEANAALDIPFRQGQMSYSLNTVMDLVRSGLAEPEVEEALERSGIDNIATSGIRVITTIDRDLQESAVYALRKELSRLDVRLRGYDSAGLQKVYEELAYGNDQEKRVRGFLVGSVVEVKQSPAPEITVGFGRDGAVHGKIDQTGLMNIAGPLARYEKHAWYEAGEKELKELRARFKGGDLVLVSIRAVDAAGQYLLDLEKYPLLQGAVLAMKEGTIRAMAGGMENRYYNRAVSAKRSMGSVIKPLVYLAAMQLGWNSLDVLNNERNVFVFQNRPYFPRPDHHSPHKGVSMSWAGVYSENVASVWLLYHLCDHLAPARFYEVIDRLGLGQLPGESYELYRNRVRDELGIVVNSEALREAAFEKARVAIEPDLIFDGRLDEYEVLKNLPYGNGFDRFLAEADDELARLAKSGDAEELEEAGLKRQALKSNFRRFAALRENLAQFSRSAAPGEEPSADAGAPPQSGAVFHDAERDRYVYAEGQAATGWSPVSSQELREVLRRTGGEAKGDFWQEIYLEGVVTPATLDLLQENIQKEYDRLAALPPYSKEVLAAVRDFRVYAGLRYLTGLCRELGIVSDLEAVLSFPLGSNVISLFEVAKAYEGLSSGMAYRHGGQAPEEGLAIIERVEDADGVVIYEPVRSVRQLVDPKISLAVTDILRNVVRHGTGRQANALRLHSPDPEKEEQLQAMNLPVPVFGKTGTANRFTNAAFAGLIPGVDEDGALSLAAGYVLAAYVGFDDNSPMIHKTTRLSGALGALPVWNRVAGDIFRAKDYAAGLDLTDLAFSGAAEIPVRLTEAGQIMVAVDDDRGGVPVVPQGAGRQPAGTGIAYVRGLGRITEDGEVGKSRYFQPYWQMEEKAL